MNKYSYILNIPRPCQENWDKMEKLQNSRFCKNCTKNIYDFTNLSDSEIVRVIEASNNSICGQFRTDQLNREISITEYQKFKANPIKWVASFLLLFFTNSSLSSQDSTNFIKQTKFDSYSKSLGDVEQKSIDKKLEKNKIRGKLIDSSTNNTISFGIIKIQNTTCGVKADKFGNFELAIPDSLLTKEIILEFNYVGYEKIVKKISSERLNEFQTIIFNERKNSKTLGIVIIDKKKKTNFKN